MKNKIALFLFALSVGASAAQATDLPDRICYRLYDLCLNDPGTGGTCYDELEACLNNP